MTPRCSIIHNVVSRVWSYIKSAFVLWTLIKARLRFMALTCRHLCAHACHGKLRHNRHLDDCFCQPFLSFPFSLLIPSFFRSSSHFLPRLSPLISILPSPTRSSQSLLSLSFPFPCLSSLEVAAPSASLSFPHISYIFSSDVRAVYHAYLMHWHWSCTLSPWISLHSFMKLFASAKRFHSVKKGMPGNNSSQKTI